MSTPLRLLLVEDSEWDARLSLEALRGGGFKPEFLRVQTAQEMRAALETESWDIILSDYAMPEFDALAALEVLRDSAQEIPFIIVSGTIGEDTAVAAMRLGATDYLLKDRLARLPTAVSVALEQARSRRERRQAVEALRLFRNLVGQSNDTFEVIDPATGRFLDVNDKGPAELGFSRAEYLALRVCDVNPSVTADSWRQLSDHIRRDGAVSSESHHRRKDGTTFPIEFNAKWVRLDRDYIVTVVRDITKRKEAEEALRRSEARLNEAQRKARIGSWELDFSMHNDVEEKSLSWSDELFRIFGYEPGAVTVTPELFFRKVHADDRQRIKEAMAETLHHGRTYSIHHRIVLSDGTERVIHEQADVIRDPGTGRALRMVGTAQDITERLKLEEQLRQSQKMEAIGQLSGGVAHDFNNLLTVIKGHIGLLRAKGQVPLEITDSIQQIDEAANRAANLTRQLLTFSRQEVIQPTDLNLNGIVSNLAKMLRRLLSESIEMTVDCARVPLPIRADEGMVEQVLLNLVVNARDAMPKGGRLGITSTAVDLDETMVPAMPQGRAGAFACLAVSDTGTGIAPEILSRIFDPFFTTKEAGKGTGLGLATVYGVMQQHGGWITVESSLGHGATFRAYFPRQAAPLFAMAAANHGDAMPGGHEAILLVEDEVAVREVTRAALLGLGYRVFIAPSGLEALQVWEARKEEISLLLTDLVMPDGITGRDLAVRLRESKPGLCVIYMSGYSDDILAGNLAPNEEMNYLPKPFDLGTLARIVRNSLDRGVSAGSGPHAVR